MMNFGWIEMPRDAELPTHQRSSGGGSRAERRIALWTLSIAAFAGLLAAALLH